MVSSHVRISIVLAAAAIAMVVGGAFAAEPKHIDTKESAPVKGDVRTLKFPDDQSLGSLLIFIPKHENPDAISSYSWGDRQLSGAKGLVRVTVPANHLLVLDANKIVFAQPELLKKVPANGIDVLRLSAISLADEEDGLCDAALGYINGIKGLKVLTVDRSEATDAGLSKIKDLPNLRSISTFLSSINGSCFKDLAKLPNLQELSCPKCRLNASNLAYLAKFPKLQILDVARDGLDETAAVEIGKCTKLKDLSLRGNKKFDDKCVSHLAALKELRYLDLGNTKVTADGLKKLARDKLKVLTLSQSLKFQDTELKAMFPNSRINYCPTEKSVTREERQIYAPLR
ncbi:MAG TPA: hypothetical protein V6C97_23360 [Oculatellaceae cyanobacterium]